MGRKCGERVSKGPAGELLQAHVLRAAQGALMGGLQRAPSTSGAVVGAGGRAQKEGTLGSAAAAVQDPPDPGPRRCQSQCRPR